LAFPIETFVEYFRNRIPSLHSVANCDIEHRNIPDVQFLLAMKPGSRVESVANRNAVAGVNHQYQLMGFNR
jgi:hypothetical protein